MKIIVAHPGKQHSYRLATALEKNGSLLYYVTTVYKKSDSLFYKILNKVLSKDNRKRAEARHSNDIPENKIITICSILGLLELLLLRLDKSTNLYRCLHSYTVRKFGIKIAKLAINEGADMVICYDSNAVNCFSYLKENAPNIKRVLDVSIASRHYMRKIYDKEISMTGNTDLKDENLYLWNEKKMSDLKQEILDSQFFLVASDFVKDSLIDLNIKKEQILKVPYGANVQSCICRKEVKKGEQIKFLFAGQVIYRKGITYALEAIGKLNGKGVLDIVGAYNPKSWFINKYSNKPYITMFGQVTFDRMQKIYEDSNVFILPSFAEGMAQVGIEAMACGLPVICTYNSGLSDLIIEGQNGFIIPEGDLDALANKMQWFIDNSEKINDMGIVAKESAKYYSWINYEHNIINALNRIAR